MHEAKWKVDKCVTTLWQSVCKSVRPSVHTYVFTQCVKSENVNAFQIYSHYYRIYIMLKRAYL